MDVEVVVVEVDVVVVEVDVVVIVVVVIVVVAVVVLVVSAFRVSKRHTNRMKRGKCVLAQAIVGGGG